MHAACRTAEDGCLKIYTAVHFKSLQGYAVALDFHTDAWFAVPPTGAHGMRLWES